MIADEPWLGWGPGSYRFVAPEYLKRNPLFTDPQDPAILLFAVNHAHDDWVQLVAEWGFVGAALFMGALGWFTWKTWQWRGVLPPESWLVLGAVGMVLMGAVVDFPLYNPAVLIAVGGLLAATLKAGELAARPA
jgi:O-antigen ligase